ncbi:hypothetical protein EDC96DRAFT_542223 [Choanephora cucurbitarum]|nr:hypothetical protein EDC96DRAFT_542223 [Choanephora cucurbitarum]
MTRLLLRSVLDVKLEIEVHRISVVSPEKDVLYMIKSTDIHKIKKRTKQQHNFWSNLENSTSFFKGFSIYDKKKTKMCVVTIDYAGFIANMNLHRNLFFITEIISWSLIEANY